MNREVLDANPQKGRRAITMVLETEIGPNGHVAPKYSFSRTKNVHDDNSYGISYGCGATYECEISQSAFATLLDRAIMIGTSPNQSYLPPRLKRK